MKKAIKIKERGRSNKDMMKSWSPRKRLTLTGPFNHI